MKRIIYIVLGCLGVALGALGAVVPLLPTFPFLMLAAFCFARSSQKLSNWFVNTKLYKSNLESFVKGQGMTWAAKIRIMLFVTILMTVGIVMMRNILVGQIILAVIWGLHIIMFVFGIKTKKVNKDKDIEPDGDNNDIQISDTQSDACQENGNIDNKDGTKTSGENKDKENPNIGTNEDISNDYSVTDNKDGANASDDSIDKERPNICTNPKID